MVLREMHASPWEREIDQICVCTGEEWEWEWERSCGVGIGSVEYTEKGLELGAGLQWCGNLVLWQLPGLSEGDSSQRRPFFFGSHSRILVAKLGCIWLSYLLRCSLEIPKQHRLMLTQKIAFCKLTARPHCCEPHSHSSSNLERSMPAWSLLPYIQVSTGMEEILQTTEIETCIPTQPQT